MQNEVSQVANVLAKLNKVLKKGGNGNRDFKAIAEAKKKDFWKPKPGKNTVLMFSKNGQDDPFTFWGSHKNLQETDYWTVPCDEYNAGANCTICEIVKSLQAEDRDGNKHLWKPIEQFTETYVNIIDYSSAGTINEGAKWWRISKTILEQMSNSIINLDEGELPFYDMNEPKRLILTYNKDAVPASQYAIEFKPLKEIPTEEQYNLWSSQIKPIADYFPSKTESELKVMSEGYFDRQAKLIDDSEDESESGDETTNTTPVETPAQSKLAKFKKN